jgi:hypothetical protein
MTRPIPDLVADLRERVRTRDRDMAPNKVLRLFEEAADALETLSAMSCPLPLGWYAATFQGFTGPFRSRDEALAASPYHTVVWWVTGPPVVVEGA